MVTKGQTRYEAAASLLPNQITKCSEDVIYSVTLTNREVRA